MATRERVDVHARIREADSRSSRVYLAHEIMDLQELLTKLRDPTAWPNPVGVIEVVHTHGSAVLLGGEHVYKLKKPVDFGFLDYSTLAKRKAMCEAEVALNRRLAPGVYLGVVPITVTNGRATFGGAGEVVEYAVHMKRLDDAWTLGRRVLDGTIDRAMLERVGRTLAQFHRTARRGADVARWASFDAVRENCDDNFTALREHAGVVAPRVEIERLASATDAELARQRGLIEERAAALVPCESHGDLRLEHVYVMPDGELCIVDCIEFSERFRCADPVSDIAFLAMDLKAHGAWDGAEVLLDAYFAESGDSAGRALAPLYIAYRSAVRAKVRAMAAASPAIPDDQRRRALQLARAHIQLAVGELSAPGDRPCLVLVGGLPGTGKSVLSRNLSRECAFTWLRADAIRKELAGLDPLEHGGADVRAGIYTPDWNDRTYGECLARAKELLFGGGRVLVDASFKEERRRLAFVEASRDWGVPVRILECVSADPLVRERLANRREDPSDADWRIYEHVRATWDEFGERTRPLHTRIDTSGPVEASLAQAVASLRAAQLAALASS